MLEHTGGDIVNAKDPVEKDDILYTFITPESATGGQEVTGNIEVFKVEFKEDPGDHPFELTVVNKYKKDQNERRHRYVLSKAKKQLL